MLHAVDTDVVVLYAAPEEVAVRTRRRERGYAEVFPDDDRNLSIALGRALADDIFFRVAGDHPLIVLPPMEQEIGAIFSGMVHRADREHRTAEEELRKFHRLCEELQSLQDEAAVLERLADEAPGLTRLLRGESGPAVSLERLRRLFKHTRIAPLSFVLERGLLPQEALQDAFAPPQRFADQVGFNDLKERWFNRLVDTKSKARSRVLIYDDAEMLARLERINRRLDQEQCRFVLITGDPSIHAAARRYPAGDGKRTFAGLYLRHPRAYLSEPGVLSPVDPDTASSPDPEFLDWLDTFLGELHTHGHSYLHELGELVEKDQADLAAMAAPVLETRPGIVDDFVSRWSRYTSSLSLSQIGQTAGETTGDRRLDEVRGALGEILESVERQLHERVLATWEACFEAATDAGYGLLFHQSIKRAMRPRNPPVLCYDRFGKAQAFVQNMLASRSAKRWDASFQADLRALLDEDPSRYTYFLAYAELFAAEGSWHVAAVLAERALEIADNQRLENISGREAAFMRAVALRHSARHARDLVRVGDCLDQARDRLARDREHCPELEGCEIRFAVEQHALHLTYHLFDLFLRQHPPIAVPALAEVQAGVETMIGQLDTCPTAPFVCRCVERRLLVNLFSIALLRWGKLNEPLDPQGYRWAFDRLARNLEDTTQPGIEVSFLVQTLFLAARWWTAGDRTEKRRARRELSQLLNDEAIREYAVMPYGRQRFRFLRDLVEGSRG